MKQETRKYKLGRSSSDMVIRFQNDYIMAKENRLRTERLLQQAWINLKLAENSILDGFEIIMESSK